MFSSIVADQEWEDGDDTSGVVEDRTPPPVALPTPSPRPLLTLPPLVPPPEVKASVPTVKVAASALPTAELPIQRDADDSSPATSSAEGRYYILLAVSSIVFYECAFGNLLLPYLTSIAKYFECFIRLFGLVVVIG